MCEGITGSSPGNAIAPPYCLTHPFTIFELQYQSADVPEQHKFRQSLDVQAPEFISSGILAH